MTELCKQINETFEIEAPQPLVRSIAHEYNENTKRCLVKMNLSKIKVTDLSYSSSLQDIIGTKHSLKRQVYTLYNTYTSVKLSDIYKFMVYTDLVSSTVVGDKEAPLLRVVPVKEGCWKARHSDFDCIQYIPVSRIHDI